jgi:heme exporter protein D
MKYNSFKEFIAIGSFVIVSWLSIVFVVLTIKLTMLWGAASLVTSSIKRLSGDCGKTYFIENVVSGNWFCEDANEKQKED